MEADESDRTAFALSPEIAVVTNVELDHHTEFASAAELEREFETWLAGVAHVVRDAPPFDGELALPGAHNRSNAGAALRRSSWRACRAARPRRCSGASPAPAGGSRCTSRRARTVVDDYGHHPSEVAAAIAAARERFPGRRVRVLFQPHLYSRTRHLATEFAAALAGADDVTVTDVYPAREATGSGRDRQADRRRVVGPRRARRVDADRRAGRRPPRPPRPRRRRAARPRRRRRRPRGRDVDVIEENVSLARHTTIGTGGAARWFARPETADALQEAFAGLGTTTLRSR